MNKNNGQRRRVLQPRPHSSAASAASGSSGIPLRTSDALNFAVDTVTVVEAAVPDGVTVAGEKLHDAPEGNPEQLKETAEVKPPCGVTLTVAVPLWPPVTVIDAGVEASEKSGGRLIVYVALATALVA
jgi:hypothetical protein